MNLLHELPPGPNFQGNYDIPQHFSAEMGHLFEVYKELEGMPAEMPGWEPVTTGWERVTTTREQIGKAADPYSTLQDEPRPES